jgi:hypothetical protein
MQKLYQRYPNIILINKRHTNGLYHYFSRITCHYLSIYHDLSIINSIYNYIYMLYLLRRSLQVSLEFGFFR